MSFERIQHERPSAAGLLSIMSFFNPQEIPEKTLRAYGVSSVHAETRDDHDKANRLFEEDIDILYAYSLVGVLEDKGAYEMHALVQFCTQVWLSSLSKSEWWKSSFIKLLALEFPSGKYETWAECQRLLPHVEPLFGDEPSCEETAKAWAQILMNAAKYLYEKGSYEAAEAIATNSMVTQERILGLDDQQTLRCVTILGLVLEAQGKYDEAEKLNRRVLAELKRELGEHHPDTLRILRDLGSVLQSQGRSNEAERLQRRVISEEKRKLGEDHVDTLKSVVHLALVLRCQGRYEEAEKMSRQALAGMEKQLGEENPYTRRVRAILALLLRVQSKYKAAEKMSRRALAGMEKELGEHHPDTLMSLHSLANLLHEMECYTEAEALYQRAFKGFIQTMGAQHPQTIGCEEDLLALQQDTQEVQEAK